jgi:hypothetical protein
MAVVSPSDWSKKRVRACFSFFPLSLVFSPFFPYLTTPTNELGMISRITRTTPRLQDWLDAHVDSPFRRLSLSIASSPRRRILQRRPELLWFIHASPANSYSISCTVKSITGPLKASSPWDHGWSGIRLSRARIVF